MPKHNSASANLQDVLIGVLCAAVAAWLSILVRDYLISNYAGARFWETWLDAGSSLFVWVPLVSFAFISGILLGVIVGLIFPQHIAVKIAGLAAVMQLVAGIFSGGIIAALVTGAGLWMGALPSKISRGSK